MLDRNDLAALKSIADELAAFAATEKINQTSKEEAEQKFRKLIKETTQWESRA